MISGILGAIFALFIGFPIALLCAISPFLITALLLSFAAFQTPISGGLLLYFLKVSFIEPKQGRLIEIYLGIFGYCGTINGGPLNYSATQLGHDIGEGGLSDSHFR